MMRGNFEDKRMLQISPKCNIFFKYACNLLTISQVKRLRAHLRVSSSQLGGGPVQLFIVLSFTFTRQHNKQS